jgi:uncharacterized RDD family membrane protein YckC
VVQAGFLKRWAALFLDNLILGAGFYALFFALILVAGMVGGFSQLEAIDSDDPPAWVIAAYVGVTLLYYVAAGLYYSLMESSRNQATLGKMALGIKVVDRGGDRLSFPHALGRWFAASLSYLTLYIGFLLAAFTQNKQALHDMVAGTQVVDRWAYTDFPERQQRSLGGCVIAFVVVMLLMIVLAVGGIIAAISIPAYQQYVGRAQFASVDIALTPLRMQVEEAVTGTAACPDNASVGFGPPESYAGVGISRIVVGEFEPGFCGISVWMPPVNGTVERQFLAEYDPDEDIWYCTSKADDARLPGWCH